MQKAFFIDEVYLKDNSPLSAHIEIKELYPFMKASEDTYIQESIGTKQYKRLIQGVSNEDLTAIETELLYQIRDALMWYVCYKSVPFLATKIRNIGVVRQTGETIEPAEDTLIKDQKNTCKGMAEWYLRMMKNWLCENSRSFPLYNCGCGGHADLPANTKPKANCDLAFDNYEDSINNEFARKWLNGK